MSENAPEADRRRNTGLRELFETAYARIAPFLDPQQTWGGAPMEYLAFRMLRETLPQLSSAQARQLVSASVRAYLRRNPVRSARSPAAVAAKRARRGGSIHGCGRASSAVRNGADRSRVTVGSGRLWLNT